MLNLEELFEKHNDEYLKFENVKNPLHPVPDICAFLMLDSIAPSYYRGSGGRCDIISGSDHDEFWLSTSLDKVAEKATEEQIIDLIRCGVSYDSEHDAFSMFT